MVWVRVGLVGFVVAWLFDLFGLRSAVPIWLPFLVALGLELGYFLGAWSGAPRAERDRGPQPVDLERYGFRDEDEPPPLPAAPRRTLPRLLLWPAVIAALAGVVWLAGRSEWDGLDERARSAATDRFSREASRIAGRSVEIRCDEAGEFVGAVQHADGVAAVGGRVAYLTPERCYDLYRLAFEGEVTFSQTARALAVLAHESWHLRGVRDEARTECYALQSGVELGRRLGLRRETARRMMRQQLAENALRGRGAVEYLVTSDCRDGGALDLDPARKRFP